ncbi:MAG: GNAT family protein [Parvularculaceae bacterium]
MRASDVADLLDLLADPRVSRALYTIPQPVTRVWVADWIKRHGGEAETGDGLLMLARDISGAATGFVDLQVWPERASAEFGGGIRADLQSASMGTRGAAALFDWLFDGVGIRLIAMTNALDNVRTARLLASLDYCRLADRQCATPSGAMRPSMYWELSRDDWRARRAEIRNQ